MDIILASGSPRRRELLEHMGITDFRIVSPDADESLTPGLSPAEQAEELARRKTLAAAPLVGEDSLLIAADTIVSLGNTILGKPADTDDAFRMLSALSGNVHHVYTGVTVSRGTQILTYHRDTEVYFRDLLPEEIRQYISTGECMDKAGAYGILGFGSLLIEGIRGDYYNVMGLPISLLADMLKEFGVDCLRKAAEIQDL